MLADTNHEVYTLTISFFKSYDRRRLPMETLVSEAARRQRDFYSRLKAAVNPAELQPGDTFFVISIRDVDSNVEVFIVRSGIYHGKSDDGRHHIVHLDGKPQREHLTDAQLDFYPLGSAMSITFRTTKGVAFNHDERSDEARQAVLARRPCPCGTVRGDGSRCTEWPDCMTP
jgi:hypothetical protein